MGGMNLCIGKRVQLFLPTVSFALAGSNRDPADGRHGRLLSLVAQLGEPRGYQYHPRQFVLLCGAPKGRGGRPQNGGTVGFAASRAGFSARVSHQVSSRLCCEAHIAWSRRTCLFAARKPHALPNVTMSNF